MIRIWRIGSSFQNMRASFVVLLENLSKLSLTTNLSGMQVKTALCLTNLVINLNTLVKNVALVATRTGQAYATKNPTLSTKNKNIGGEISIINSRDSFSGGALVGQACPLGGVAWFQAFSWK